MEDDTELSSEVGILGQVFKANIDIYWASLERIDLSKVNKSQKAVLREEFAKFYFWGEGFYPFEGRLDGLLSKSSQLRERTLSVLCDIGTLELAIHRKQMALLKIRREIYRIRLL
jgi:hypothetical protein